MLRRVPAAALLGVLLVLLPCAAASAQDPAPSPFSAPRLRDSPKGGFDATASATATPTASPTAVASATSVPTAAATAAPTVTATAGLPNTGADPLRLALAGLSLLGFGLALRFRMALADVGRPV